MNAWNGLDGHKTEIAGGLALLKLLLGWLGPIIGFDPSPVEPILDIGIGVFGGAGVVHKGVKAVKAPKA